MASFRFCSFQDIDDMDADLFGSKRKPSSAPAQRKEAKGGASKAGDQSKTTGAFLYCEILTLTLKAPFIKCFMCFYRREKAQFCSGLHSESLQEVQLSG